MGKPRASGLRIILAKKTNVILFEPTPPIRRRRRSRGLNHRKKLGPSNVMRTNRGKL